MDSRPPGRSRKALYGISTHWGRSRNAFFALLFPWKCPGCSLLLPYPAVLCEECSSSLKRIRGAVCKRCGNPFPEHWRVKVCPECRMRRSPLRRVRSPFYYEGVVQQMILDAKYRRCARMLRYFAEQLYLVARSEFPPSIEALVPVPLHRTREWERTFNQAELVAQELGRLWGIPVWHPLSKVKKTPQQTSLSGIARRVNLQGAFRCKAKNPVPKSVLLIDDVITTGATLEECARTLRHAGVGRVYAITIARAVKDV